MIIDDIDFGNPTKKLLIQYPHCFNVLNFEEGSNIFFCKYCFKEISSTAINII